MSRSRRGVDRLGSAPVGRLLWELSSQTTLSLLVYALYALTDTYFLSVGVNALAAAAASILSPVLIALGGVATIVGVGGASIVSRALGEGDIARASRTVANTFLIFWTIAASITLAGSLFLRPIVYLLGATDTIAPYALAYGRIIFLGALTATGYSSIVRADGSARFSAAMWIIPVCSNILLSWLFVMVIHLGAGGAALATVLAQSISPGMSLYFFFFRRARPYRILASYFRPCMPIIKEVVMIGLPSFLRNISVSLVVIVTNNLLRAIGGDTALAVFAIVNRLYATFATPQTGMVQGMQPLVGYNFGRRQLNRVWQAITRSIGATIGYGLIVAAICWLFPAALISLLSKSSAIVASGQPALRLMALSYPFSGITIMVAAYFQSIGSAREALLLTLGGILLVRLPVLVGGAALFGLNGIWASWGVSELLLSSLSITLLLAARRSASGRGLSGRRPVVKRPPEG